MAFKIINFRKGRKAEDPCTVHVEIDKIDGDENSPTIKMKIVATISALNDLSEMAWVDPTGLGRVIAEAMSADEVQDVLNPEAPKRWNESKSKIAREIMRSARWIYALAQQFKNKKTVNLPAEWIELITFLEKRRYILDTPELIAYAATTEAYLKDAESVGLKVFNLDEENEGDDPSETFNRHYLFSSRIITPSRLKKAFLNLRSPDEMIEISPLKSLLSKIKHRE